MMIQNGSIGNQSNKAVNTNLEAWLICSQIALLIKSVCLSLNEWMPLMSWQPAV